MKMGTHGIRVYIGAFAVCAWIIYGLGYCIWRASPKLRAVYAEKWDDRALGLGVVDQLTRRGGLSVTMMMKCAVFKARCAAEELTEARSLIDGAVAKEADRPVLRYVRAQIYAASGMYATASNEVVHACRLLSNTNRIPESGVPTAEDMRNYYRQWENDRKLREVE